MEEKSKKALCSTVETIIDSVVAAEFLKASIKAAETMKVKDWQRFWVAVHNLDTLLGIYNKLKC